MTRIERFEKRMFDLRGQILEATRRASLTLEAYKADAVSKTLKKTNDEAKLNPDQLQIVNALNDMNVYRDDFVKPITELIGIAIKACGGDFEAYAKAVASSTIPDEPEEDGGFEDKSVFEFPSMAIVKIMDDDIDEFCGRGHNYPLNTPVLLTHQKFSDNRACIWDDVDKKWVWGEQLPNDLGSYGICSVEEIEAMIENIDMLPYITENKESIKDLKQ